MQAIGDLFQKFDPTPSKAVTEMAAAVGEKRDTVYRWLKAGRIPETSWEPVIDAAARRGVEIDAATLIRLNRPSKRRGRKPKALALDSVKKKAVRGGRVVPFRGLERR